MNNSLENEVLKEVETKEETNEDSTKEKTQMELDAEEVKKLCKFKKPLSENYF